MWSDFLIYIYSHVQVFRLFDSHRILPPYPTPPPSSLSFLTMGVASWILLLLTHPNEFRQLLQFYIYHEQKRDIKAMTEHATSGWNRGSMQRCWHFLDLTSRSFSAVIKELEGDLARTVKLPPSSLGLQTCESESHAIDACYLCLASFVIISLDVMLTRSDYRYACSILFCVDSTRSKMI
jgi:hypothetical protein